MTQQKRMSAAEFSDVWEEAYEDVKGLLEDAAFLLPKLERIRKGVLGAEAEEAPRRRAATRAG